MLSAVRPPVHYDKLTFLNPVRQCKWATGYELIAALSKTGELVAYRLKSTSRAWLIFRRNPSIEYFVWRPDGLIMAVGFSDGTVSLLDGENGKESLKVPIGNGRLGKIVYMDWAKDPVEPRLPHTMLDILCYDPRCDVVEFSALTVASNQLVKEDGNLREFAKLQMTFLDTRVEAEGGFRTPERYLQLSRPIFAKT
ncbi:hypothetical protein HDU97_005983 [Phlyctochytrium planicorne]|nr:hypothetical protein HDU97_005983 [Phlyctochytrium planicorne]